MRWEIEPVDSRENALWEYDVKTLARDLSGHLPYGAGTGTAFWVFAKLR